MLDHPGNGRLLHRLSARSKHTFDEIGCEFAVFFPRYLPDLLTKRGIVESLLIGGSENLLVVHRHVPFSGNSGNPWNGLPRKSTNVTHAGSVEPSLFRSLQTVPR